MFLIKTSLNHQLFHLLLRMQWFVWFVRTHLKKIALDVSFGLAVVILIQLVFPSSLARPRTYVGGHDLGLRTKTQSLSKLQELNSQEVTVRLVGKELKTKLSATGLSVDTQKTMQQALDYKWYHRLIPFSIFGAKTVPDVSLMKTDAEQTESFAQSLGEYNLAAEDAAVSVADGKVVVVPAKQGTVYEPVSITQALETVSLTDAEAVVVTPTYLDPTVSTDKAQALAAKIEERLSTPFTVQVGSDAIAVDSAQLSSWVTVAKTEAGELELQYSRDKIKETLRSLQSKYYIAQVANTVTLVDGETTSSVGGSKGQVLDLETSVNAIVANAAENKTSAQAVIAPVNAATKFVRSYTRSQKGLQALMSYWVQSHGGQFGVSLQMLDGSMNVQVNGDKRFTSASIYKLYLADVVYTRVTNGQLSLGTAVNGTTVAGCIDAMIVRSDNACAVALGNMVGWSANDGFLHGQGFGQTTLSSGNHLTTASNTASLLTKLQNGSLIASEYRGQLLAMMQRQIYRSGIPAGSVGGSANKVGFLGGLNHDAAIVYHPKGTYALVVMSSGSSFGAIADLSRQISALLNQ